MQNFPYLLYLKVPFMEEYSEGLITLVKAAGDIGSSLGLCSVPSIGSGKA